MNNPLKTLFNTPEERHAFLIGLCELFPPWKPQHPEPSHPLDAALRSEHHYYLFGRTCSFLLAIAIITSLIIAFR